MPRGLEAPEGANAATVSRLLVALRDRDERALAAELSPEIEARGQKGSFTGVDAVVGWAKPNDDDGYLRSRIEVDDVRELGDRHVAMAARRQWRWVDDNELAAEDPFGALFELRDGRIYRWRQDFGSIIEAIDAIPPGG